MEAFFFCPHFVAGAVNFRENPLIAVPTSGSSAVNFR